MLINFDQPAMGESEARAMRIRMFQIIRDSAERMNDTIDKVLSSGKQSRKSARKRVYSHFIKHMKPAIIQGYWYPDKFSLLYFDCDGTDLDHLQLNIVKMDKRCRIQMARTRVKVSAHALERLIQYLRVREFDKLDEGIAAFLVHMYHSLMHMDTKPNMKIYVGLNDGKIYGNFVVVEDKYNPGEHVVVTFVGHRSYNPETLNYLKAQGVEVAE